LVSRAVAKVEHDPDSLRVEWDRSVLARADEEARMVNGRAEGQAAETAIEAASAARIARSLNFAPQLLHELKDATLQSELAATIQGKPARALELVLPTPGTSPAYEKRREVFHRMMVWIDDSGVPVVLLEGEHLKLNNEDGTLLFEDLRKRMCAFGVVGNRLVLLNDDEEDMHKSGGKSGGSEFEYAMHNNFTFGPER
jgi:hypothetical protein